jgi:ATP-dependent DNA helicase RecQ
MKVVIVAKTRMGSGACVGALTFEGWSLRLIAADRETNDQFNMDFQVGEVWEVETRDDPDNIPPHVENVIVYRKRRIAPMSSMAQFIEGQMPPLRGGVEVIFEGLTQATPTGTLYIAEHTGIPQRSTMFWQPDQPLVREDDQKRIRYRYPTDSGGYTLTFVGFQEPVPEIPAGTIVRVSLAHWWRPKEMPEGELRCYVQISGWFTGDGQQGPVPTPTVSGEKETCEDQIPRIDGILKDVFGYHEFRPLQRQIIEKILCKQDTLAVMPTGSGKSLCFQLPALLFPGLTVVVSPLISLMEDQVLELKEWGIPADYLNSTLTHDQYLAAVRRIKAGETKLVYAAPETLLRPETILLLENNPVDCLVIDEAHCISEWGHDFRPEYRQLAGLRARLPQAVTLGVTATATQRVQNDIKQSLQVPEANVFVSSFNRENLVLSVVDKLNGTAQAKAFLEAHKGQAGIIYCATRDQVDVLAQELERSGYPALPYHAGMEAEMRRAYQRRFRFEEGIIMVATIAFGMGINKSNVRFVLHYDLPKNLENYYQQIGRSGRDGLNADCLMLFSYGDISTINYFIDQEDPKLQPGSKQRLRALIDFLETEGCRRVPLLRYFGEAYPGSGCGACDNCALQEVKDQQPEEEREPSVEGEARGETDLTTTALYFLTCALETGEIFGVEHLIRVLRGSKAKKIYQFKHDKLSSYGMGKEYSAESWRHLAAQFVRRGLLKRKRAHRNLVVTEKGKQVLMGETFIGELPGYIGFKHLSREDSRVDRELFEKLRALRASLARERNLPPYTIFHDSTLTQMAANYPLTSEAFLGIHGIGTHKLEQYGAQFLKVIQAYCQGKGINPNAKVLETRKNSRASSGQKRTEAIWERYQEGMSIQDLADAFGFKPITIINHLYKAFNSGRSLGIAGLKEFNSLSSEESKQVLDAFRTHGTEHLKPVFNAQDGEIAYDQLHLWRLIYQVEERYDSEEEEP